MDLEHHSMLQRVWVRVTSNEIVASQGIDYVERSSILVDFSIDNKFSRISLCTIKFIGLGRNILLLQ